MHTLPIIVEALFPDDLYKRLRSFVLAQPLEYGSRSHHSNDPFGHMQWAPTYDDRRNLCDLTNWLVGVLDEAWGYLRPKLGGDYKLIRCYVNGYTYGMDGYFHTDSEREGDVTVIVFMNDKWAPDWAGETICMDDKRYLAALPKGNRAVVLPSNMLHCARAVSRICREMRVTLMFKARKAKSEKFEKLSTWLSKHGAVYIDHQNGSLHDHLCRVYESLSQIGLSNDVCFGGGLHSIYGTNAFQRQLIEPTDNNRAKVADEFGRDAEQLAYKFSLINRPDALENIAAFFNEELVKTREGSMFLIDLRHSETVGVSRDIAKKLCLIEAANLEDQDTLKRWPTLTKLWKTERTANGSLSTELATGLAATQGGAAQR